MVFGMEMRKTGAPTQDQPGSVVTDGTRLLLTGGKHDEVVAGCPVGEKGRGGYELG